MQEGFLPTGHFVSTFSVGGSSFGLEQPTITVNAPTKPNTIAIPKILFISHLWG
jgi:hypothetical protein